MRYSLHSSEEVNRNNGIHAIYCETIPESNIIQRNNVL